MYLRAVAVNQRPRDPADQSVPGLRPGATRRTLSPAYERVGLKSDGTLSRPQICKPLYCPSLQTTYGGPQVTTFAQSSHTTTTPQLFFSCGVVVESHHNHSTPEMGVIKFVVLCEIFYVK